MRLIDIAEFSKNLNIRKARGYELARQLPPGVRVELGRQIRINEDALNQWVAKGGTWSERKGSSEDQGRGTASRGQDTA